MINYDIEWSITQNCNFNCDYCGLFDNTKEKYDIDKIKQTIRKIKKMTQKEVFIFGGEPFLHPFIKDIIRYLNEMNIRYVIQTNLSTKSTQIMKTILDDFNINISVHNEQQSQTDYINNIKTILSKKNIKIKTIDVMWTGIISNTIKFNIQKEIHLIDPKIPVILTPVSNFLVSGFDEQLREYNKFRDIFEVGFEDIKVEFGDYIYQRSYLWEKFNDGTLSPKGKPCYKKDFLLIDWDLKEYNCVFKKNIDGCCPFDTCFMS